ncbi:MAG: ABC transporter ATP-binding protein [Cyanobacteria bacterium P01_H01_bin.15]
MTALLRLENICKQYCSERFQAVDDISLALTSGDILGLVGPSGCGKTTLLRIVAGFEAPTQGRVVLGEQVVAGEGEWLPPEKRDVGMVFQDYALFPHLTVAGNVGFGLRQRWQRGAQSAKARVQQVLDLVGLGTLGERFPHQISGGQQQRVALARALAPNPQVILLDEPMSNLDAQVRQHLRDEIRRILKAAATTAIFVTHDREEALAICDRLGVMNQGRLEQLAEPEVVFQRPASRFVAEFMVGANFLAAQREGQGWCTEIGRVEFADEVGAHIHQGALMIPETAIALLENPDGQILVRERRFLGREYRYELVLPSGQTLFAKTWAHQAVALGATVELKLETAALQIFGEPVEKSLTISAA